MRTLPDPGQSLLPPARGTPLSTNCFAGSGVTPQTVLRSGQAVAPSGIVGIFTSQSFLPCKDSGAPQIKCWGCLKETEEKGLG